MTGLDVGTLRKECYSHFARGIRGINLIAQPPEVNIIRVVFFSKFDDKALGALEAWGSIIRDLDFNLSDGNIAVKVVGVVFNHDVLKGGHWHGKSFTPASSSD